MRAARYNPLRSHLQAVAAAQPLLLAHPQQCRHRQQLLLLLWSEGQAVGGGGLWRGIVLSQEGGADVASHKGGHIQN